MIWEWLPWLAFAVLVVCALTLLGAFMSKRG